MPGAAFLFKNLIGEKEKHKNGKRLRAREQRGRMERKRQKKGYLSVTVLGKGG